MKINFNWGTGIAAFYTVFVLLLIGFLFYSRTLNNDLVEEDYYVKEIAYQGQIDKINRTIMLNEQLEISNNSDFLMIQYPMNFDFSDISGDIHLYRPSDKKLDKKIHVIADSSNKQILNISTLDKGLWKVKIHWNSGDSTYYNEENMYLK